MSLTELGLTDSTVSRRTGRATLIWFLKPYVTRRKSDKVV